MNEDEVKSILTKYNIKILGVDKDSIWSCVIGKNQIKLGLITKKRTIYKDVFYYISLVDRFDCAIMFDEYKKCCNLYETETDKHFKELREFRKIKQLQEDFK